MNVRQGSLLRTLLDAHEFLTCDHFATILGCSEKTVRTDAKALNAFLEREQFASRILSKRGAGMRLTLAPNEENRLARLLDEYEIAMRPRLERLCHELIVLICTPGAHSVATLAKRLYTNKKQIQIDLHWWQSILCAHGISLKTGRSIAVEGSEWAIRKFIMTVLFSFSPSTVKRRIEPSLTNGKLYDQIFYERSVDGAQDGLGFQFSSNARWQLLVYLKIMIARIKLGHTMGAYSSIRRLSPYFSDLRRHFERHFGVEITLAEMHLLQDMHICCTWQWSSRLMEEYQPDAHAVAIAREIIDELQGRFRYALPSTHHKPLGILVEAGLVRQACGFVIPDPNEETVKYENMDSFCLLSSVLNDLPSLQKFRLHSSDYTRIALMLLEYLEQADCQRQYRAGLVVNCGIDLALHGKHRIEKFVPRVRIVDIVTENEVQSSCAHGTSPLFERFDFLISFEPLAVSFPCVAISGSINERDVEHIISSIPLWRGGREAEVPWSHRKLGRGSGDDFIRNLYDDLERLEAIAMPHDRFVWLFETLSFVKGRTVVFTLCGTGVQKTCMHLYQTSGDTHIRGRRCSMAAVLLVQAGEGENLTPMTEQFKRLLAEHTDSADRGHEDDFFAG